MEGDADDSSGQTPLKGVVLCCTSLTTDVRTNLADVATQMGAVHKLDLTADVTHLVVGCITTPKYQYVAKDRPDIKVLDQAWVAAVRDAWMEGGDVDVPALEEKHKLPTFFGLQICVTGFDDMEQRGYISQTVEAQGAAYHGDLTKQITHLIAAAPQGPKYTHAKQWGLKIVSLKWFQDSLARGLALEESLYDPTIPLEEQGQGAFRTLPKSRTSLGKRVRDSNVGAGDEQAGKKKLRRTASTRLESQSQDMWSQLSAREAGQTPLETDRWQDDSASDLTLRHPASEREFTGTDYSKGRPINQANQGLFSGCYVLSLGFDDKRTQLLRRVLSPNGATLLQSVDEFERNSRPPSSKGNYLIIPHAQCDTTPPDVPPSTSIVTEWWVERCIHTKQLLDPAFDVLSRSLSHVHITGFSLLTITTTGFEGVDFRQVAQAIKIMGGNYQEGIDMSTSVIIAGSATIKKEKAFYAKKHGIPVVTADWLWTCIDTSELQSFHKFRLEQSVPSAADLVGDGTAPSPPTTEASRSASGSGHRGKDDQSAKRLSTIRKRHATPSLHLQASRTPSAAVARPPPIMHEDDDDDDSPTADTEALSAPSMKPFERRSHPLQEVSPNRSPRKLSQASNEKKGAEVSSETLGRPSLRTMSPEKQLPDNPCEPIEAVADPANEQRSFPRPREQLTADLTELLNRQTASRPGSASNTAAPPQRRKSRPLGRAPSGISNRSLSASAQSDTLSQNDDAAVDGYTAATTTEPLPPSTQLGYETLEAEAHRLQMSKKMGMRFQDEEGGLKRVASVGTVKDSSVGDGAGVGSRVKGRRGR